MEPMPGRERQVPRLAWTAYALTTAMVVAIAVFAMLDAGTRVSEEGGTGASDLVFALMVVAFAALGALVASRRPSNPIGWILCVAPLLLAFTGLAGRWYLHNFYAEPGSLPVSEVVMWAANWAWIAGFVPLLTLLLLLFPEGRPTSRAWRPVGWLAVFSMSTLVLGYAFAPGPLEDYEGVVNPIGLSGVAGEVSELFLVLGFFAFALAAILSMASLVVRFRRSARVERQQLKWMAAAGTLVVIAWLVNSLLDQVFGIDVTFLLPLALLALPAAATVAVLRYRFYDLDLVVNQALVYGGLTVSLAGSYLGLVLLQLVLSPESDFAIAGSTLAVAALFRPLRTRIQALVDRRFYRRKYDAAHTIERFSTRLRSEVDLEAVSFELSAVARETMQPAHVSIWLRAETTR